MVNIVTGIGPRVGSSFIMRQCKIAGLEVHGSKYLHGVLPPEGNPGGYYDLTPIEIMKATSGVAKVWPVQYQYMIGPPAKVLVVRRLDREAQLDSIVKQAAREKHNLDAAHSIAMSEDIYQRTFTELDVPTMEVYTEELNDKLEDILTFLGD